MPQDRVGARPRADHSTLGPHGGPRHFLAGAPALGEHGPARLVPVRDPSDNDPMSDGPTSDGPTSSDGSPSTPPAPSAADPVFEIGGVTIRVDPVTLRERVSDPEALSRWADAHPDDPAAVAALRMLERLDEAEAAGRRSLAAPGLHPVTRALRRARYAHVLQWQGRFEAADEEFSRASEETGMSDDPTSASGILALAGVLQHRAKNRFEHAGIARAAERPRTAARLLEAAVEDARRALAILTALGASADQITSSRATLARLEAVAGDRRE